MAERAAAREPVSRDEPAAPLPAYVEARRRLAGRMDRDWLAERLSRVLVGGAGRRI